MAASLAERAPGDEEARPRDDPGFDRQRQRVVGAAGIAHRREAALEHGAQDRHGLERHDRIGQCRVGAEVEGRRDDMHVAVDQPRHQRASADIHDSRTVQGDGPFRNLADRAVLDDHVAALPPVRGLRIEDGGIAKDDEAQDSPGDSSRTMRTASPLLAHLSPTGRGSEDYRPALTSRIAPLT
jgi:hypothetical protein